MKDKWRKRLQAPGQAKLDHSTRDDLTETVIRFAVPRRDQRRRSRMVRSARRRALTRVTNRGADYMTALREFVACGGKPTEQERSLLERTKSRG